MAKFGTSAASVDVEEVFAVREPRGSGVVNLHSAFPLLTRRPRPLPAER